MVDSYITSLEAEIALVAHIEEAPRSTERHTLYFGGGTPSLLDAKSFERILLALERAYGISSFDEFTVEANPDSASRELLFALAAMGANRLSLGVQSTNDSKLLLLNRLHNARSAFASIDNAQKAGFANVSCDLIYGVLPNDVQSFGDEVRAIVESGARHLSLYALTLYDDTPLFALVREKKFVPPDDDNVADTYYSTANILSSIGFDAYEVSNFAMPCFESQHNSAYWNGEDYIGFGCAAHSFVNGMRYANISDVRKYVNLLGSNVACEKISHLREFCEKPTRIERIYEKIFLSLRLSRGLDINDCCEFKKDVLVCAERFLHAGVLLFDGRFLRLARESRLRADGMAAELIRNF